MFDVSFLLTKTGTLCGQKSKWFQSQPEYKELQTKYYWCETLKEIVFCVTNNITHPVICKICSSNTNFTNKAYKTYCSYKCANTDLAHERTSKGRQTIKEKYGVNAPHLIPGADEKRKQTNINRYGHENPNKNKTVRDKIRQTNIERYGASCFLHSKDGVKSRETSCIRKYGVSHHMKTAENRKIAHMRLNSTKHQKDRQNRMIKDKDIVSKTLSANYQQIYIDLAKSIGMKLGRFKGIIKKYKLKDPNKEYRLKEEFFLPGYKGILEHMYETQTFEEIGKNLQISPTTVWRLFAWHEIKAKDYKSSTQEKEIVSYLKSIGITNIETNRRDIINPLELDIYLPDYKLAIEFNGDFWHTQNTTNVSHKHQTKYIRCYALGIKLLQIRESDWERKKHIWKSIIKNAVGKTETKIYARKCVVREVSKIEANNFLNNNHLQGQCISGTRLGLFYQDQLVMVQTFGKSRFKKDTHELLRMACLLNTQVIGGAGKLFAHFIKNYSFETLQTFADLEYSSGDIYTTLGFTHTHTTPPNYHYYFERGYHNRMNFTKKKFSIPDTITEKDYFINLGYRIYWDAGQKVFNYHK